jgi:hypothetical protein
MPLDMPPFRLTVTPMAEAHINKSFFFAMPKHKFKVKYEVNF